MARIVLAYAATGKTHAASRRPESLLDMVSMPYKYILPEGPLAPGEAEAAKGTFSDESTWNMEWPGNYVDAVLSEAGSGKWEAVLCPSDPFVLAALSPSGHDVEVVVPGMGLKEEYRERFAARGSAALVEHLIDGGSWERNIESLKAQCEAYAGMGRPVKLTELGPGEHLLDVL